MVGKYKIGMAGQFSKTISESDVYLFAGITGDMNPIHIDCKEAEKSIFKGRIAHGLLAVGLISNVIAMRMPGPGTVYMEQMSRFVKPVRIGDTVTASVEITEIINEDKHILKLDTVARNQHGETVVSGYAVVKAP